MNSIVEKAQTIDQYNNNLPDVEQGGGGNSLRDLGWHRRSAGRFLEHPAHRFRLDQLYI